MPNDERGSTFELLSTVSLYASSERDREKNLQEAQLRGRQKALIGDNYVMCHVFAISSICQSSVQSVADENEDISSST